MTTVKSLALTFGLLLSALLLASPTMADDAMIAWVSEPEAGETEINVQIMNDDHWLEKQSLYRSRERNYSPAIGSNTQGDILVAWTATSTVRSVLRAMFYQNGMWQPVEILANQGGQTTRPAIIFDRNDNASVVWVSDHNGLDDVYISRWNRDNNEWSPEEQVNPANTVPDIQPSMSIDIQGNVVVHWKSVDEDSGSYVDLTKVYQVEESPSLIISDEHRELSAVDIDMPENWQKSIGRAEMHFPDNIQIRQEKIATYR